MKKILGSFRNPSATVFELNDKINRAIYKSGEKKFHHLISTRILEESTKKGFLIDTEVFKNENLNAKIIKLPRVKEIYSLSIFDLFAQNAITWSSLSLR